MDGFFGKLSVLVSLCEGGVFEYAVPREGGIEYKKIELGAGDAVVFGRAVVHRGGAYADAHLRMHVYLVHEVPGDKGKRRREPENNVNPKRHMSDWKGTQFELDLQAVCDVVTT